MRGMQPMMHAARPGWQSGKTGPSASWPCHVFAAMRFLASPADAKITGQVLAVDSGFPAQR
jgi:NAD(P)-dependent dehydrogenase (short-subunit alcohol dehydrogenase family)